MAKKSSNPILIKLKPVTEWAAEQVDDGECAECGVSTEEDEDIVHDDECIVDAINELATAIHASIS